MTSATTDTFRHALATDLPESGEDLHNIQKPRGDQDIKPTMIYTHVLNRSPLEVNSPADVMQPYESVVHRIGNQRQVQA